MLKATFMRRKSGIATALISPLVIIGALTSPASADDDPWPDIQKSVFGGRAVAESSEIQILAPNQAEDAAIVPVSVKISPKTVANLKSLTLVIDRNPMPVAATFAFAEAFRNAPDAMERSLSTRVRVDAFSRVRAVAELADGSLIMASKFVIGAGGCSAPAQKDADKALAELGKAQVKLFGDEGRPNWREGQIMIKHPNFTGMQMDKSTGNYTPARYIDSIEVRSGGQALFKMEGGISISENPQIRFTYGSNSPADLEFTAKDTMGTTFEGASAHDPS